MSVARRLGVTCALILTLCLGVSSMASAAPPVAASSGTTISQSAPPVAQAPVRVKDAGWLWAGPFGGRVSFSYHETVAISQAGITGGLTYAASRVPNRFIQSVLAGLGAGLAYWASLGVMNRECLRVTWYYVPFRIIPSHVPCFHSAGGGPF